jgi:Holliday junction resolvase RusA-like endonuclease
LEKLEEYMEKIVIDMKLPSLNDYIKVCRSNKFQAAKYKKDIEQQIGLFLIKMPKYEKPIKIHFTWIEGNKKRDLDNVAFSKKFILDTMVKYGKLKDDNRNYVYAFTDSFEYGKETKVILEIEEKDGSFNNI